MNTTKTSLVAAALFGVSSMAALGCATPIPAGEADDANDEPALGRSLSAVKECKEPKPGKEKKKDCPPPVISCTTTVEDRLTHVVTTTVEDDVPVQRISPISVYLLSSGVSRANGNRPLLLNAAGLSPTSTIYAGTISIPQEPTFGSTRVLATIVDEEIELTPFTHHGRPPQAPFSLVYITVTCSGGTTVTPRPPL